MAFLNTQDQLRAIEWSRKYLWDIRFTDAPEPFNEFFPAIDVDESLAVLTSKEFKRHLTSFKTPQRGGVKSLRITFADDALNTLSDWISDWMNRLILNEGSFISTVDKAAKKVQISKLNSLREELSVKTYWVVPEGELVDNRSSSSDTQAYSMNFYIVGEANAAGNRQFADNNP